MITNGYQELPQCSVKYLYKGTSKDDSDCREFLSRVAKRLKRNGIVNLSIAHIFDHDTIQNVVEA